MSEAVRVPSFPRSGAIAGAASAFVFVVIYDMFISDIWFSLVVMLVASLPSSRKTNLPVS